VGVGAGHPGELVARLHGEPDAGFPAKERQPLEKVLVTLP
jgi:hypothetical protein